MVKGNPTPLSTEADLKTELKLQIERFEYAASATTDVIRDLNIITNDIFWGGTFEKRYGYKLNNELKTRDFWIEMIHPDDREIVIEKINSVIADVKSNSWEIQYRLKLADGQFINVLDKTFIIRDDEQKAIRAVGAIHDNTQLISYQQKLLDLNEKLIKRAKDLALSNAELERFAYVASHDLQEPLRMITGFLELLKKKYGNLFDETAEKYIGFAVDGALRMKSLIRDLLEYSRLGNNNFSTELINIEEIVNHVEKTYRTDIQTHHISIIKKDLPSLVANREQMIQLFQNLIGNAIKYRNTTVDLQINISAILLKDRYKFSITDNGIGIDMKFANKIFVIFQRLHQKEDYPGTGIGLAICNKIVRQHHGDLWVNSEVGVGSTFYFTILSTLQIIEHEGN